MSKSKYVSKTVLSAKAVNMINPRQFGGFILDPRASCDDIIQSLMECQKDYIRNFEYEKYAAGETMKDIKTITTSMNFMAECAGQRESCYDLSGREGIKFTLSGMLKVLSGHVERLGARAKQLSRDLPENEPKDYLAQYIIPDPEDIAPSTPSKDADNVT